MYEHILMTLPGALCVAIMLALFIGIKYKLGNEALGQALAAVGFYYWKARAENRIKLRKKNGAEIYNDAMKEDTDYE